VMGYNPSQIKGGDLPVENVSWYDALVFANKLSMKEGLKPAYRIKRETDPSKWGDAPTSSDNEWNSAEIVEGADGWRLPGIIQWEFAAKSDESAAYFTHSASGTTREAGKKKDDEFGPYDMSGIVYEWCFDTYEDQSEVRVRCGGIWYYSAGYVRFAPRYSFSPYTKSDILGFRLVRP